MKKHEQFLRCKARKKVPKEETLLKLVNRIAKIQEPGTVVDISFVDFKRQKPNVGKLFICVLSPNQAAIFLNVEEKEVKSSDNRGNVAMDKPPALHSGRSG